MKQSFLDELADQILAQDRSQLSNLCIILPSQRAGIFLRAHLEEKVLEPLILPEIITIESFVYQITGLRLADQAELLMELFLAYKQNVENPESFDAFLLWGHVLLGDFNEMDFYMLPPAGLFSFLTDAKAVSLWNPDGRPLSDVQRDYLAFFASLWKIYSAFQETLLKKHMAYSGMAFRKAVENLPKKLDEGESRNFWMVGLNALTNSEIQLINLMQKHLNVRFFWDYDRYYTENNRQEAGLFARENKEHFGSREFNKQLSSHYKDIPKTINIVNVAGNIGQAAIAARILNEMKKDDEGDPNNGKSQFESTALVLNDEQILLPVLNEIPEGIPFNISMAYSFTETPLYQFVLLLLKILKNIEDSKSVYYKDVISLFRHPLTALLLLNDGKDKDISEKVCKTVMDQKRSYYSLDSMNDMLAEYQIEDLVGFLVSATNAQSLINIFDELINRMRAFGENRLTQANFYIEQAFVLYKVVHKLESLLKEYNLIADIKSFGLILKQLLVHEQISFMGDKHTGLQIMGVLETRALDFDQVIMLSVNEDMLPMAKNYQSFIPYDIKSDPAYALPGHNRKVAVFAYHFYRLLQRASKVWLIYNSQQGSLGGGEESRFIRQLQEEISDLEGAQIKINNISLDAAFSINSAADNQEIEKTEYAMQRLHEVNKYGFSPSALNVYRNCSLKYYYQYILQARDKNEIEDQMSAATFGSVLHRALETLFEDFIGKNIVVQDIERMLKDFEAHLLKAFEKEYAGGDMNHGYNYLSFEVLKKYARSFLKKEKQLVQNVGEMRIVDLEKDLHSILHIPLGNSEFEVNIRGKADRIDSIDGQLRLIDYKSGKADLNNTDINNLLNGIDVKFKDQFFQLMVYSWAFLKSNPSKENVLPGIISFHDLKSGLKTFFKGDQFIDNEAILKFEAVLGDLFVEMFDREVPFVKADASSYCGYCDFKDICGR